MKGELYLTHGFYKGNKSRILQTCNPREARQNSVTVRQEMAPVTQDMVSLTGHSHSNTGYGPNHTGHGHSQAGHDHSHKGHCHSHTGDGHSHTRLAIVRQEPTTVRAPRYKLSDLLTAQNFLSLDFVVMSAELSDHAVTLEINHV